MMLARGGSASAGGGPIAPPLPTFSFDFKAGVYSIGATSYSAADVISDPTKIINGTGLVLADGDTVQHCISAALTQMLVASQTLRFTLVLVLAANDGFTGTANDADDAEELWYAQLTFGGAAVGGYDDVNGIDAAIDDVAVDGQNILVFSYGPTSFSLSVNGSAVQNATGSISPVATQALLGGFSATDILTPGNLCTIEKIDGFELQSDAALPALSALP